MARVRALSAALFVLAACAGPDGAPPGRGGGAPARPEAAAPAIPVPSRIPAWNADAGRAGALACGACHAVAWAAWRASPHGRAMAEPGAASVLGAFDGRDIPLRDGAGRAVRTPGGGYAFELPDPAGGARAWPVDLVLASGRTHQLYVTRTADRQWRLLPVFWASRPGRWGSLDAYRPSSLDPDDPDWWGHGSLLRFSCLDCHASGAWYERAADGGIDTRWVDLAVDCEECHQGAGAHARAPGDPARRPPDLHALSAGQEARLCGRCHAYKLPFDLGPDDLGLRVHALETPAHTGFRPDATQHQTVYQTAGHLLSACYRAGGLQCGSCHDPHSGGPRDLAGRPAEGPDSHRQCTVCHRDREGPIAAASHTGHPPGAATCTDCHMGWSWILDSPATHQRTADHSIATPRPAEAERFGASLSCLHCHDHADAAWVADVLRRWGADGARGVRPWVEALAAGRAMAPGALPRLLDLLEDPASGAFLRVAALTLAAAQAVSPEAVPRLLPWADHPDPGLRANAIRALMRHDRPRAGAWRRRGSADPDPLVRLAAFGAEPDLAALSGGDISRAARDTAEHALGPSELIGVYVAGAKAHLRRADAGAAKDYLAAARAWALPEQAAFHELDRLDWLAAGAPSEAAAPPASPPPSPDTAPRPGGGGSP